jgi:DMSO reductase family type II enzyme heme b subunit
VKDNSDSNLAYQTLEDLNAEGYSTLTDQNQQNVKGGAAWENNKWRLVFTRSLTNGNANDVQFKKSVLMATAVWNGSNKELNGQKGIAGWLLLKIG